MNDSDSFFGIDIQKGDSRLTGAFFDARGGSITPEIIDAAAEAIKKDFGRPPCGMKGNPHLVVPRPIGARTHCIQCGYPGVRVSATDWRGLNKQEIDADVLLLHMALYFHNVKRHKKALIRALRIKAKGRNL